MWRASKYIYSINFSSIGTSFCFFAELKKYDCLLVRSKFTCHLNSLYKINFNNIVKQIWYVVRRLELEVLLHLFGLRTYLPGIESLVPGEDCEEQLSHSHSAGLCLHIIALQSCRTQYYYSFQLNNMSFVQTWLAVTYAPASRNAGKGVLKPKRSGYRLIPG